MRTAWLGALAATLVLTPAAGAAPPSWPAGVDLSQGMNIDEDYRAQFDACDTAGLFRGEDFTNRFGCRGDPNRVTALRRMPGGAVAYVSKLSIDFDGSPLACGGNRNRSDQCPTSLMLTDASGVRTPVNADRVPYVVIPNMGPPENRGEFFRLTGARVGDFGVVIWNGTVVPVIVADTGPYNKLGEGSVALHRALGHDPCAARDEADVCREAAEPMESIGGDVVTILFPGSARTDLAPETLEQTVRAEGMRLWDGYRTVVLKPGLRGG